MSTDWLERETHRKYHEVADLFPLLDGPEFEELKADIAANGLIEPIDLHPDGSILDGRNRHRACIETETEPRFQTWDGDCSAVQFVVSKNLHRRHLSSSQRAAISLDALAMLEAETQHGGDRRSDEFQGGNNSTLKGKARDQAASLFNTNPRYVQDAKKLRNEAPDLFEEVKAGEKSILKARRELIKRQRQETPPLPTDKYRIIYADPPWKYGNTMPSYFPEQADHYALMTVKQICELPVRDLAADDAVLFLWATSPILEEAFEVVDAWGFEYKTSFVWDKVRHVMGHYNSVRHEFLLVCTRGSCLPDANKLFDSVVTEERTKKHSEKPETFRKIIDTLYTYGKRIELFARIATEGWEAWGYESE